MGELDGLSLECFNEEEIKQIGEKVTGKISKSQKKQLIREKCLEYKLEAA